MSRRPSSDRKWLLATTEILAVGLPFSVFKVFTGQAIFQGIWRIPGGALIALGVVDLGLNLANLASYVLRHERVTAVCLLDFVMRRFDRKDPESDLGIALDVFLSFALVAAMVGLGLIPRIAPRWLPVWNVAVVLNVLGAGVGRLFGALRHRRAA